MEMSDVAAAIAWQADHAQRAFAPITARIIRAELAILETGTATGRRMANWAGLSLEDAMPLRVAGALHHLYLSGDARALEPVYAGLLTDQGAIDRIVADLARIHDTRLLPWLDSPPQTNEAGRSASVMAGLLWLSARIGPRFDLLEIGASAGINTMMHRFSYDLGGVRAGPQGSPIHIAPAWRGTPPPDNPVEIVNITGCDIAPVSLSDPAQALRLKAYVWADAAERMLRMDALIAMAAQQPPDLVQADALDFLCEALARPQQSGTAKVLFHTVMWQYLPPATRKGITQAMQQAGAGATSGRPLAWIRVETNRQTFRHELKVRYWPARQQGSEWVQLAEAHPHGAWVEWSGNN